MIRDHSSFYPISIAVITAVLLFASSNVLAQDPTPRGPAVDIENGDRGDNGSVGVGIVGDGGDGERGDTGPPATVIFDGTASNQEIVSGASNAHGINAQSRGGRGGNGGFGVGIVGFGGDGGRGGHGGTATVNTNGSITTTGNGARGIFARSRGNNGGSGGGAGGIDGEGGDGGSGGRGGTVRITAQGDISTSGTSADGMLALSTGATGGAGGSGGGIVGIGGGSSSGGAGGTIRIDNDAAIDTSGRDARGIAAQSIGGFGGGGGSGGGIVGIGGQGSTGGNGGSVTVVNRGTVTTRGSNAQGIFVESIGGGGGNAGGAGGAVSLGGSGNSAGNGGSATVSNDGDIVTEGYRARGILAQSIGGGGGDGAGSGGLVSLGGGGGSAGDGRTVSVTNNTGAIVTQGPIAHGILAQSIGGGGGSGAGSGGAVAIGGSGSGGGDGGRLSVTNNGEITTNGVGSRGILAQSIGGGGGDGAGSGGIVAVGGSGSGSGGGGEVNVTNGGTIRTTGSNADGLPQLFGLPRIFGFTSHGILAQSIGGGGGSGAGSGGAVSVGGRGSSSGDGGLVTVSNSGSISTADARSRGIFVQSIGGGGGDGGGSGGLISIGGSSSRTGNSATVTVTNSGSIFAGGDAAQAIFAQSVGGGGGDGGGAGGLIAIGGSGQGGGDAGAVVLGNDGELETAGSDASAILAQSVGGGGGNGGGTISVSAFAGFSLGGRGGVGGSSNTVDITNGGGSITTAGERSHGIHAQSVGGGGGNGGHAVTLTAGAGGSVSLAVGGRGAGAGHGRAVDVDNASAITTSGDDASGILAQSIGGGGGNGGFSIAGAGSDGVGIAATFGGLGGAGGNGSTVVLDNSGLVTTAGDGSTGILAQSVGGGGGNGGFRVALGGGGAGGGALNLGGSGGSAGNAGVVTLTDTGAVSTAGNDAHALFAQSIGGGGGNGSFGIAVGIGGTGAGSISLGANGGGGGHGADVNVTSSGIYQTQGNRSFGVFAQSIGGGGGNGGANVSGAGAGTGSGSFSLGGGGGGGGNGAIVTVVDTSSITTRGNDSYGLFAQSLGGGGGNGGFSIAASGAGTGAGTIGIGGSGGSGGHGNQVSVDSSGLLMSTSGHRSSAIVAQSVGGGGGNGGFDIALNGAGSYSGSLGVGGSGGAGGHGGNVILGSSSAIVTVGAASRGLLAQSIGGGGGNGAFNVSGSGGGTASVSIGVGGGGGVGGNGGTVSATNRGSVVTTGFFGHGMQAQSIGGGGGNGGLSFSGSVAGPATKSVAFSLGGSGGAGGTGGQVDAFNHGTINTSGHMAYGVAAQSIGGGGGNGGMAIAAGLGFGGEASGSNVNAQISVGGGGGNGNLGGVVSVSNTNSIQTGGINADGVFAQSIGGGGGSGGSTISGFIGTGGDTGGRAVNIGVAVGGGGGNGSDGGLVDVDNFGEILVSGAGSTGITAQSIGGGGGIGGRSNAVSLLVGRSCTIPLACTAPAAAKQNVGLSVSVGGAGGGASDGGLVDVYNNASVSTGGDEGHAIFAQSVGGGGGNGGNGILGSDGLTPSPVPPELIFFPVDTVGFLQRVTIAVGGAAGASGNGGMVVVDNDGALNTSGYGATGVFAQSIGGGGGNGGNGVIGLTGLIGMGGADGSSGNGGELSVFQDGDIVTSGDTSHGVFAQSVGGGGGTAGNVERAFASSLNIGLGIGFSQCALAGITGRRCGNGGDGGVVTVTSTGNINTSGVGALGIFAQSVGGGGGVAGDLGVGIGGEGLGSFVGSVGGAGSGDRVTVTHTGNITTTGAGAHGIMAQSAGGQGTGAAVDVTIDGRVEASGSGSSGVVAQSSGDSGGGDLTVEILQGGAVVGGLPSVLVGAPGVQVPETAGVRLVGGNDNNIINGGTISTSSGIGGFAIHATAGNDDVENFGVISGSIDLGSGSNTIRNRLDAELRTGVLLLLGDDPSSLLTNEGELSVGGRDRTFATTMTGNLLQTDTATLLSDIDVGSNTSDVLVLSGFADIAGTVDVNVVNAGMAMPGAHQATLISAAGGLSGNDLNFVYQPSVVIRFDPLTQTDSDLQLNYSVSFAPQGVNGNHSSFGEYVNRFQLAGGSGEFAPVAQNLTELPDLSSYQSAVDQLNPEIYLASRVSTVFSMRNFANALQRCSASILQTRYEATPRCAWIKLGDRNLKRDTTGGFQGFAEDSVNVSLGYQNELGDNWGMGLALSYENTALINDSRLAEVRGDLFQAGVSVKSHAEGWDYSASFSFGKGHYRASRGIDFLAGGPVAANGTQDISFATAQARMAHTFGNASRFLRPVLNFTTAYIKAGAVQERDAGVLNLDISASNVALLSISPSIEFGGQFTSANGATLRPFGRLGAVYYLNGVDDRLTALLQDAPDSIGVFGTQSVLDDAYASTAVGLEFVDSDNTFISLSYEGLHSGDLSNESFHLRVGFEF